MARIMREISKEYPVWVSVTGIPPKPGMKEFDFAESLIKGARVIGLSLTEDDCPIRMKNAYDSCDFVKYMVDNDQEV